MWTSKVVDRNRAGRPNETAPAHGGGCQGRLGPSGSTDEGGKSATLNVSINRRTAAHDPVSLIHESECPISCTEAAQDGVRTAAGINRPRPRKRTSASAGLASVWLNDLHLATFRGRSKVRRSSSRLR